MVRLAHKRLSNNFMPKIKIRPQKLSDAERFYEILTNPNFIYFGARPKSLADEKKWLKKSMQRKEKEANRNYSIIFNGKMVGGIGAKINYHRRYVGELGYCIDEKYWGKGIASQAVRLLEDVCFKKLKLMRIEIVMRPENKASEKVAIKNGYKKEGLMKKALKGKDGKMHDCYLYAKVK